MKKSRFSDSQILAVLKQAESGVPVPELCREFATRWLWTYNNERPKMALGGITPK
jgi:transposase InsO family protein